MPIRLVMALFQVAVYAAGTAPDVAEIAKTEGPCTNFKWAKYENGTLEILHCDDKLPKGASLAGDGPSGRAEATNYHQKINTPHPILTAAAALPPSKAAAARQEHAGGAPSVEAFAAEDVKL